MPVYVGGMTIRVGQTDMTKLATYAVSRTTTTPRSRPRRRRNGTNWFSDLGQMPTMMLTYVDMSHPVGQWASDQQRNAQSWAASRRPAAPPTARRTKRGLRDNIIDLGATAAGILGGLTVYFIAFAVSLLFMITFPKSLFAQVQSSQIIGRYITINNCAVLTTTPPLNLGMTQPPPATAVPQASASPCNHGRLPCQESTPSLTVQAPLTRQSIQRGRGTQRTRASVDNQGLIQQFQQLLGGTLGNGQLQQQHPAAPSASVPPAPCLTVNPNFAISDTPSTNVPSPTGAAGSRQYIIGVWTTTPDNPAFHTYMGFYPDYTINNSYVGPDGGGYSLGTNAGYPQVVADSHIDTSGALNDANASANGSYNSAYANTVANTIAPYASSIYAIRIDFEWAGNWFSWSPYNWNGGSYTDPSISPTTWIAGWRNFAAAIRANRATAHIKLSWDYPLKAKGTNALAYYPGDDVVDIISTDIYFDKTWGEDWNFYDTSPFALNDYAAFATQHGKPMAFWEWGDNYGDWTNINNFGNWMNAHNVVAMSYWDSSDSGFTNGRLQDNPTEKAAFANVFGNTHYAGSYWSILPLPGNKPAGF